MTKNTNVKQHTFGSGADAPKAKSLGAGLAAFARRYQLSSRRLSAACGGPAVGVSKSSADRICRGVAELRLREADRLAITQSLSNFLRGLGKTESEIQAELLSIFSEQEIAPMIILRTKLPLDTQQYFGLRRDPFALESNPRTMSEAYTYPQLDAMVARVEDAINFQGFLAVIGEIGSGKTTLKKRILDMVRNSSGRMHIIWPQFSVMERVEAGAIVQTVLEYFEQRPHRGLVASQRQVERLLSNLHEQGQRIALGFDECHRLNDTTLLALKNFYELGTGGYDQYLGIVLFGQPCFMGKLNDYRFREIAERLEIADMPELGKHAFDYLAHRIRLAGGDAEKLFEKKAVERLAAQSSTPLALGNLANAALIQAHKLGERKVLSAFIQTTNDEPKVRAVRRAS